MDYQRLRRRLRALGFQVLRQGSKHEIWVVGDGGHRTTVPRHTGDIPPGTLQQIRKDLGLEKQDLE